METKTYNQIRSEEYHYGQYRKTYRSTEVFIDWIGNKIEKSQSVCDLACGGGANLHYMAKKYPNVKFEGIDIEPNNINIAKTMITESNVEVFCGDILNLPDALINKYSGITCFQTLSWLPEYNNAIRSIARLNPDWIAISSLFYDGNVEYKIEVSDYTRKENNSDRMQSYYNIYSIPRIKELFRELGYNHFEYKSFDIDIDIEKTVSDGLHTYTRRMEDGSRIQISAGLMLPWYFIIASK